MVPLKTSQFITSSFPNKEGEKRGESVLMRNCMHFFKRVHFRSRIDENLYDVPVTKATMHFYEYQSKQMNKPWVNH